MRSAECAHDPHRLSQSVLRIARHTGSFRGSAIVPTILSFLSRALKRRVPLYTRASLRLDCFLIDSAGVDTEATLFTEVLGNADSPKSRWRILPSPGPRPVGVPDSNPCVRCYSYAGRNTRGRFSLLLTVVYGVLVIGAICLAALAGLELVQRLVPADSRQRHNDVAGFIYAALGVIYAVLLALVVIAVWEEYDAASETVEQEANAVAEIFWLAHRLPEPEGRELQELCRSYAEEVVNVGWPLMEQGRTPSMERSQETSRAWVLIDDIRASLQEIEPHTKADEELYAEGLDQVQRLADARRMRLVAAEEGIPGVLWAVLIFGGIAVVSFTYLFGLENTWAHRLMVLTLAGVIGLVLFTIGAMEHPFSGGARIGTEAFDWCWRDSRPASLVTSDEICFSFYSPECAERAI